MSNLHNINPRFDNGYQGIFASPDSEEKLLLLESLGIKIYETDSTKILRSLAHGIDAFASYEGNAGGFRRVAPPPPNVLLC